MCGAEGPRDDMFGAEPHLLCEACSDRVRQRMAPSPTGRLVTAFGGPAPLTVAILVTAGVLFLASGGMRSDPSTWTQIGKSLMMVEATPALVHDGRVVSYRVVTAADQPWRLLTSAFLHIGFLHILFNAWWIWDLGRAIEGRRKSLALALLVVGSAVTASALQWLFSGPGVGLSGVVYALAGWLFTQRRRDPAAAAIMNPGTTRLLIAWLVLGVILSETGAFPIGNWAHGGGLAWGLAAGFAANARWRIPLWIVLGLVTAGLVVAVHSGWRTWSW